MGERSARVSLPKCLDTVDPAEADGRLIADLVSCFHGNVDFGSKWREYKKMAIEQGFYV